VFKLAVTFRALGRSGLGALVDACHDLARYAAGRIDAHRAGPGRPPVLTTVVFATRRPWTGRCELPAAPPAVAPAPRSSGDGGRPRAGRPLKFTLLNPAATHADVDALVAAVAAAGAVEDAVDDAAKDAANRDAQRHDAL